MKKSIMNPYEYKFVREYCIDFNFEEACSRAGITLSEGRTFLKRDRVRDEIEARRRELINSDVVNVGFVLMALKENVLISMGKQRLITNDGIDRGYQDYNPSAVNRGLELLGKHLKIFDDEDARAGAQINIANLLVSQWEQGDETNKQK